MNLLHSLFQILRKLFFFGEVKKLKIINPISEDLDILRPSLIPNLLASIKKNTARGIDSLTIFEAGSQYSSTTPEDQINSCLLYTSDAADE